MGQSKKVIPIGEKNGAKFKLFNHPPTKKARMTFLSPAHFFQLKPKYK